MIFTGAFLTSMSGETPRPASFRRHALCLLGCACAGLLVAPLGVAWARPDSPPVKAKEHEGVTVHFLDPHSGRSMRRFVGMETLAELPQHTIRTRTPWTDGVKAFTGPRLADVIALASNAASYQTLRVSALNDYVTNIPAADLTRYGVVLAMHIDGRRISVRQNGPLFVMYPFDARPELRDSRYYGRAVWQVHSIDVR